MPTLRLFIAVDPPAAVASVLRHVVREVSPSLKGVRWVRPGTLHLTLKFLGDTTEERMPEIAAGCRSAVEGIREGHLAFAGLGVFPDLRRPGVLWAGVQEGGEWLTDVAERVDAAMAGLGFPLEMRPFRAHLTLGRIRRGTRLPEGRLARALDAFADRSFGAGPICSATLYASTLSKEGAVHQALAEFPFAR